MLTETVYSIHITHCTQEKYKTVCIHKSKTRKEGNQQKWKMSNSDDTVDAGTQWVEEREASCQTEDMMVDSFNQTLDMVRQEQEQEEKEEEFGRDEGSQTMLSESVTLAFAILANRSEYHP